MAMFRAANAINGKLCKAYATIDGVVQDLFWIKTFEAKIEKNSSDIAIMGDVWLHHKGGSLSGSISMTAYYVSPVFRDMLCSFGSTQKDTYFTMTIVNADPGSEAGTQTLVLHECNLNSVVAGKFDVDADALEEDLDFSFSHCDYISKFKNEIL